MRFSRKKLIALFLGTAACCLPLHASAQEDPDKVLFEADEVTRETQDGPIIARGNVKAYFGVRYLESDEVIYTPETDVVIARGNVSITDDEGQSFFAEEVTLDSDLQDGIASNFGALLKDQSRIAGANVIKSSDGRNELRKATYSSCDVCTESGEEKTPSWQVKAQRVVQDPQQNVIRFNNAILEVIGVPVFYTPFLQIPDPSVERQSGFLTPKAGSSTLLGAYLETPYYVAISDHQDATFSPKFMSDQGTLVQGEYRRRTRGGQFAVQVGAISTDGTEETQVNGVDRVYDVPGSRYHIFAKGAQEFAEHWITSFDINHVSDDRYLRSYDVEPEGDLKRERGLYRPDRLRSTIALNRITDTSLLSIEGIGLNSLRSSEDNDFAGQALPRVSFIGDYETPVIGGVTTVKGNLLSLWRKNGLSSNRAIVSAAWEKGFTTKGGHRFKTFAELRGDYYQYNDVTDGNEVCNVSDTDYATCVQSLPGGGVKDSVSTSRFLPTAGIEWSYPLAKKTDFATFVIEPRMQFVVSPDDDFSEDVLNEDAQFFEFDAANLYEWSKGSGFDVWEDGQRVNIGISGMAKFNNGTVVEGLIGQQFRAKETDAFITDAILNPGIARKSSDVVGAVGITWSNNIRLNSRFRLDSENGTLRNNETTLSGRYGPVSAAFSYLKILAGDQTTIDTDEDQYLTSQIQYKINDSWQAGGSIRRDLTLQQTVAEVFSISYGDECTLISLDYRNDRTRNDGFDFDRSINIRLELRGFNG